MNGIPPQGKLSHCSEPADIARLPEKINSVVYYSTHLTYMDSARKETAIQALLDPCDASDAVTEGRRTEPI